MPANVDMRNDVLVDVHVVIRVDHIEVGCAIGVRPDLPLKI